MLQHILKLTAYLRLGNYRCGFRVLRPNPRNRLACNQKIAWPVIPDRLRVVEAARTDRSHFVSTTTWLDHKMRRQRERSIRFSVCFKFAHAPCIFIPPRSAHAVNNLIKSHPSIQALIQYLTQKAAPDASLTNTLRTILAPTSNHHVGLVLSERLINMPVQVVPHMYRMLLDEIKWALEEVRSSFLNSFAL